MTILAGHTHSDQYHVLGNNNLSGSAAQNKPFATWFSAGSVVQYNGRNPAFRVYRYNRNTFDLENFIQYRFDTKRSNEEGKPYWFRAYDAKGEYGLKDVSAASMEQLSFALASNDTLWKRYQVNKNNGVPQTQAADRNATVCNSLAATSWQYHQCRVSLFPSDWSLLDLEAFN